VPDEQASDHGGRPELRDTVSLLGASLQWTTQLLDAKAARRAERWLAGLTDEELLRHALRMNAHIVNLDIDDRAKKVLQSRFVPAMKMVRDPDPDTKAEGRALVEQFCVTFIREQHLAKPAGSSGPP